MAKFSSIFNRTEVLSHPVFLSSKLIIKTYQKEGKNPLTSVFFRSLTEQIYHGDGLSVTNWRENERPVDTLIGAEKQIFVRKSPDQIRPYGFTLLNHFYLAGKAVTLPLV